MDPAYREVPANVEVITHPIKEPYGLATLFSKKKTKQISSGIISNEKSSAVEKLMLYVRGNFFIPDARVGWVKPSVIFLTEYISRNPIDVLITTGPPHSLHLIGMQLQKELGIRWIADFRDPWTTIHYHKSLRLNKASARKHKEMESSVLKAADTIVVTSPTTKKEFEALTNVPIEVVTNGYDVSSNVEITLDSKFSISHIGSLLSERNPEILWEVLSDISKENPSFKKELHLKFAGAVSEEVKRSLQKNGLLEISEFYGYVSHSEAMILQRQSQILLLVEIDSAETRAIIPGKLFEYLSAERPIIALGPKKSDIESVILETNSGYFFNYDEVDILKSQILHYYKDYNNNSLKVSSKEINKYSRRELTRQMARIIQN